MSKMYYRELYCGTPVRFWMGLAVLVTFIVIGLGAAFYMEHNGHWVTGMTNQVVWGLPHVFAIFLIVAASGALNVASIGSVFGGPMYKPLGRYSSLLNITGSPVISSRTSISSTCPDGPFRNWNPSMSNSMFTRSRENQTS